MPTATNDPQPKERTSRLTRPHMTAAELAALPVAVDLPTAGRAFGIGRTTAFELARTGDFPCAVLKVGRKFRVARHEIYRTLGMELPEASAAEPSHSSDAA